ncbi:uncharacterized protein FA14DRAFT_158411 [Meira miltonrushii]|uniref:Uncharacterized protein n=1 Tax=Meira miltonrushii TaxID=1280837 RepID=A0A316V816_9BASI|nr:uncharacterized protein FA14DRAFT_158411 [Meira miltonrushii]PWN31595.1 hypothetical protein FA14DRAFT_158411 [Meira miltonrushii]
MVILPALTVPTTSALPKDELEVKISGIARPTIPQNEKAVNLLKRGAGSPPRRMTVAEHNNHIHEGGYVFATSDGKPPNGQNKHPYVPKSKPAAAPQQQHQAPAQLPRRTEKHLPDSQKRPVEMLYGGSTKGSPARVVMKQPGGGVAPAKTPRTERVMNKVTGGLKKIGNAFSGRKH